MKRIGRIVVFAGLLALLQPAMAFAHCDALDGPVVQAARTALAARDVTKVLRWVQPEREAEIRAAFDRTLEVRKLGADAQALADTWFFETLVRSHRAGEGAGFDGLKPAGHIEPTIAMADGTLDKGAVDPLLARVTAHVSSGVTERFRRAREAKAHADENVEAGRRYVAAYVEYIHYVEGLHRAASVEGGAHVASTGGADRHPR